MSLYTQFDHYNLPIGADHSPFGFLEAVRDESIDNDRPIGWSECHGGFWVVAGFPEAQAILRDNVTFSNRVVLWPQFKLPGSGKLMLGEYDPPEHTKYRRVVQPQFSPAKAIAMVDQFWSDIDSLIDDFIEVGRADLSEALTSEIGGRLTAMLCGLPAEQGATFRSWVEAFAQTKFGTTPETQATLDEWGAAFEDLLSERRAAPGDDVMSVIVNASIDGRPMTDEESRDYFTIMLLGSIENFHLFFSTILWRLGWDVELRRRLIAKPELIRTAVEEFIRYYSSGGVSRYVATEATIGGVTMLPGQIVTMLNNLIHRDPRGFDHPDTFIADRTPNRHIGMGIGIHRCLGAHLVPVITRVLIEAVLRRMPEYELDRSRPPVWHSAQISGFESVTVVFPAGRRNAGTA